MEWLGRWIDSFSMKGMRMKSFFVAIFLSLVVGVPQLSLANNEVGMITLFAGNYAPANYAFCDGQLLSKNDFPELFAVIGTTYGGDGNPMFALPDLRGRIPVGSGQGSGRALRTLGEKGGAEALTVSDGQGFLVADDQGQAVSTLPGSVVVNFLIAVKPGALGFGYEEDMIGEIKMSAYSYTARERLSCRGDYVQSGQYTALLSVMGYSYGNAPNPSIFFLPDLRDRFVMHRGAATEHTSRRYVGAQNNGSSTPVYASAGQGFTLIPLDGAQLEIIPPYLGINYSISGYGNYPGRY